MALYRIHKKEWEKGNTTQGPASESTKSKKRKHHSDNLVEGTETAAEPNEFSGGGRKGVSSGLSTVVKRSGPRGGEKTKWWKQLGGGGTSKGSMRLKAN